MTPLSNVAPSQPSPAAVSGSSLRLPKTRLVVGTQSPTSSISTLPYRGSSASLSSLFASTSSPPISSSELPNGVNQRALTGSVFAGTLSEDFKQTSNSFQLSDPRSLIVQAYVPHIAVHTSIDTDELIRDKGFPHGLWQLLRPFGDHVQGKVTIRDSIGASRVCDDFAVRIVQLGDGFEEPVRVVDVQRSSEDQVGTSNGPSAANTSKFSATTLASRTGGDIVMIENVVDRHLSYAEIPGLDPEEYLNSKNALSLESDAMSPFYILYLRRLLSGVPMTPHETFSHPVACIIAISSRNLSPIETLRRLYEESKGGGERRLPPWVNSEYLRYYVLIHDEERDDINKSTALFEQMKRHFGLHCHLLRLRSTQCVLTDDDSVQPPQSQWISAAEELAEIQAREAPEEVDDTSPCIFESDATAIRTFIREMVTQSVVPSMERCISTWNDQVVSRRRGISGRFISLSKKWTSFGGGSRNSPATSLTAAAVSNSNYDAMLGFYRPDAPEAKMRKLADYAFMLRDWKLAQTVYDLLRADFNNDKAWRYHAAANEMAALTTLLVPQVVSSKTRSETVDQMLENASYSYLTRCGASYEDLRCLLLGMELLRLRGGSATDDAARWGSRLLEGRVVGSVSDALIKERVAICYATRKGAGSRTWGARTRKAALWKILAIDEWLSLGKYAQAEKRMIEVQQLYNKLSNRESLSHFSAAKAFLYGLEREIQVVSSPRFDLDGDEPIHEEAASVMDEESEALDLRSHPKSLIGTSAPPVASLGTAPLQILQPDIGNAIIRDDNFERF